MPGVLTIYNCGTNYDRTNSQELIASLALKTVGTEGKDWIINPGPGSSDLYNKSLRARIAGLMIGGVGGAGTIGKEVVKGFGSATGSGMSVNVNATVDLVRKLKPARINMAGWSRGAITCIEIANAITQAPDIPGIPMSLFLVDPVPGPHEANAWNWSSFSTKIPGTVTHCSAILQEGDSRGWMMAPLVDPFRTQDERKRVFPMPGPHSASVEVQKPFEPVSRLARSLVETFLDSRGTELKAVLKLGAAEICDLYGQMMLVLAQGTGRTSDRDSVPNAFRSSLVFVNGHHWSQSSVAFPGTTQAFCDLNSPGISEALKSAIAGEVRLMKRDAPGAYLAFTRAVLADVLSKQPIRLSMPIVPMGPTIGMPGSTGAFGQPPAMKLTARQEFLLSQFRG
ncbi:hypothetical protein [uncultured Paludibaculum sp.]|uniref:hypothetical protein n=1 Tax=uncultured Paludibaculum sp. TaxID=1765020 RepID=UPI002AAAC7A6|nr:hypothetical protein [uncultured Paludibaculum sp.]